MTYRALSAQALAEHDYDAFLTELQKSLTDEEIPTKSYATLCSRSTTARHNQTMKNSA
jgi:hypothetical protein